MSLGLGLLFGFLALVGGLFQFLWGDILQRDHLAWSRRWPLFLRIPGGAFRMWPKRFDRPIAVVSGLAFMVLGVAILIVTAIEALD